jgi:steroid 5-alpha reductase family enzyme
MDSWSPLVVALAAALGLMTLVWVASLVRRDASIVDVFWSLGSVVAGWIYFLTAEARTTRGVLDGLRPRPHDRPADARLRGGPH